MKQSTIFDGTTSIFKNGITSALGKRKSGIIETTPMALSEASVASKKRRIDNTARGPALSRFMEPRDGKVNGNIMDSFRAHYLNTVGGTEYLPESENKANVKHPIARHIKPLSKNLDPVSTYELAFLFMKDFSLASEENDIFRLSNFGVEQAPLSIINPATLNYALLHRQLADAEKVGGYQEYLNKTPHDYMANIRFEGVPETEVTSRGNESSITSGFGTDGRFENPGYTGYKLLNVISKGEQNVFNYFGPNIRPGATCWAVVKKFGKNIPDFRLCPKRNLAGFSGAKSITKPNTHGIHPYFMAFVCVPHGGQLSLEHLHYQDELGRDRYDAFTMFLGTVNRVPVDHQYEARTASDMQPFTDSYSTYNNGQSKIMLPNIIFDSNDGCDPFPY